MTSLWLVLALPISTPPDVGPPIVRATMHEGYVYTSGVVFKDPDTKLTSGGGNLWLQKMDLKGTFKITSLDYVFGINGSQDALLRWQLIKGQYYCVAYSWAGSSVFMSRLGTLNVVPLSAIESVNADGKAADLLDQREKYGKLIEAGPGLGLKQANVAVDRCDHSISL